MTGATFAHLGDYTNVTWGNVTCPDETNSDIDDGNGFTCLNNLGPFFYAADPQRTADFFVWWRYDSIKASFRSIGIPRSRGGVFLCPLLAESGPSIL